MTKLGLCYSTNWKGWLTKFFTGSHAYHVLWVTDKYVYDMNLLRRRRDKFTYSNIVEVKEFEKVTESYLETMLTTDNSTYGFIDYLLFSIRPIYHLIGKSTRNSGGTICSEMVNNDLIACGYETPWNQNDEPPSPADIERWVKG